MFEEMTYEKILSDMLDRVTSDVDKREGSVIYDALAPCAYFLADQYFRLRNFTDLLFVDTSIGEYLDRCVNDLGMERKPASRAVRKVTTSGDIPIGSIWSIGTVNYTIREKIEENIYSAECNSAGEVGNQYSGELSLISGTTNETATLGDIITAGADEETDEALRNRYYDRVRLPATSGNVYHYKQWAKAVQGVGDAKVIPLWNGNGTVKIIIVDSDYEINPSLESSVLQYIENERPIGATVTVTSPTEENINVSGQIILDGSKTKEDVESGFKEMLDKYLKDVIREFYSEEDYNASARVSYARVGNILLETEGVEDYNNLQLNGTTANISVESTEIPVMGTVTLTETTRGV